jgi:NAD(P)H-flavin reductase
MRYRRNDCASAVTRIAPSDRPAAAMRIAAIAPQGVEDIRSVRLESEAAASSSFDFIPGQFLHIRVPSGEASYFAIASPPGESYYDVLVKRAAGASRGFFDLEVGTTVHAVGPQGKGFPLDDCAGLDIILIGVGTGIAPLRSVVGWALGQRERFGRLILLHGVLTPRHTCYRSDFEHWQTAGVDARVTVTSTEGLPWSGPVGFVQDLLPSLRLDPRRTVACLVGMKEMVQANTEHLLHIGLPAHRILLNF